MPRAIAFAGAPCLSVRHVRSTRLCTSHSGRPPHARRARMCSAPASTAADVDRLFARLMHKNPTQRHAASSALGDIEDPAVTARLVELLSEQDTSHRRAAVQALGMSGSAGVAAATAEMKATGDMTVRASCAKALAAAALFHPGMRESFPDESVSALSAAIAGADPVTKIAAVGCLGTLGCDAEDADGGRLAGNTAALDILVGLIGEGLDVATGAVAVGAVAQIGQNGTDEVKKAVTAKLKEFAGDAGEDNEESGFNYVQEMARNHVEQLEGGPAAGS